MRAPLLGALAALVAATATPAATLHVCPDGSGEYPDLHAAVEAAASGDEIELCDGIFTGIENLDLSIVDKNLTFRSLHGSSATTIDVGIRSGEWDEYEPHMAFILDGVATSLEGLSIIHAVGDQVYNSDGAAIRCTGGSLTLNDVQIGHNPYGGVSVIRGAAVSIQGGTLSAYDCDFQGNQAIQDGGAIYAEDTSLLLQGCSFVGNGSCGESVVWSNRDATIEDCVFEHSGGPHCENAPSGNVLRVTAGTVVARRCRFSDNVTRSGSCAQVRAGAQLILEDCLIEGAIGESGGAVATSGEFTARNCVFRSNRCAWTAAAITGTNLITVEGCVFHDNWCFYPEGREGAGAIKTYSGTVVVRGCTFDRNGLRGGAAVSLPEGASLIVENTVFAFGGGEGSGIGPVYYRGDVGELVVRCTDIFGNAGGDWVGCLAGLADQDGNFAADPRFCSADTEDFELQADSPCAPENAGECGLVGALPVACGTTALQSSTFGRIKGMYR